MKFYIIPCLLISFIGFAQAQDGGMGLREETTTLETIYQEKVRSVLNNLMNPEDYTLVVSATLRQDETRLKEYNELVAQKFLPGLTMNDPMGFSDAHNILLELKQKVDIQIILTDNVPSDRDNIVREVIKNKLHLSDESGDSITVVRAARNSPPSPKEVPPKMPELSAKMIAFWIIMCMMILTAIVLWLQRRKEKKREAEKAEQALRIEQAQVKDDKEEEEEKPAPSIPDSSLSDEEKNEYEVKIAFTKGELLKLADEFPLIVTKAVEEFIAQGKVNETVIFMEAIGWDESKRVFKNLDSRFWTKIGAALRARESDPTLTDVYNAIHFFHRFALSFVLERTAKDDSNPFHFIFQLGAHQRLDLLNQETPENIALIGIYCTGPQMGELLQGLASAKQNDILLHLTKLKQLPEAIIKESVDVLLNRLERIKADPSIYADGPLLAADFLRSLPAAREEELISYLLNDHPEEGDKLRKVRVMFHDIPSYPQDLTRKVIESFPSEDIQKALVGYDSNFVESFLSLLPTKKALMIQNDIYHMTDFPPVSQCAENRRKICERLEEEFELQRFKLDEYWEATAAQAVQEVDVSAAEGAPEGEQVTEQVVEQTFEQPAEEKTETDVTQTIEDDDQDKAA